MSEWDLYEGGHHYDTISAETAQDALDVARDNVDSSNYCEITETIWIDVRVCCKETGEDASDSVALDPPVPKCARGAREHDWQSPHRIVGGLVENPGVWGHGGGVVIREVCMQCGCGRVTDTWAQKPATGEQGLESVSYEPKKYADEIARP
jgi:hypothetical protein